MKRESFLQPKVKKPIEPKREVFADVNTDNRILRMAGSSYFITDITHELSMGGPMRITIKAISGPIQG